MKKKKTVISQDKALKSAIKAALKAGDLLLHYQKKLNSLKVDVKISQGVVSQADKKSEELIIKMLSKEFPGVSFLAEESSFDDQESWQKQVDACSSSEWCWVIDPLDGTTNFLGGMDYFGICIALLKKGKPVMGLVYQPRSGRAWSALKGKGTRIWPSLKKGKSTRIMPTKNKKDLKDCLFVTGFASEKGVFKKYELGFFEKMIQNSRGIRRMGSAALDMCFTTEGIFDGFWEIELAPWDVSASSIICMEAGLKVTDYNSKVFSPFNNSIMVARTPLFSKLKAQVS